MDFFKTKQNKTKQLVFPTGLCFLCGDYAEGRSRLPPRVGAVPLPFPSPAQPICSFA